MPSWSAPREVEGEFLAVDLTDYGQVVEAVTGGADEHPPVEAVVHLAAIPAPGLASNAATFANNSAATFNVLAACRAAGMHHRRHSQWRHLPARRGQSALPAACVSRAARSPAWVRAWPIPSYSTERGAAMILPSVRDPCMVTIRRGGMLTDVHHQLLATWAAGCAEHVLGCFEREQPHDSRPREAIAAARAWARGDMPMMEARAVGGHAMGAARPLRGAARFAAYAAGQAACVGHVAEHDLGAAAYAIKAARSARPDDPEAARAERDWQRAQLPEPVRQLVLDDQARRNNICWSVFSD